ncbi:GTP cyclohydrolase I [Veillonella atypica]|nr:GTP cyclohydrolase I [Veillonella atypica]
MNQLAKEGIEQFLRALSVDTKAPELEKTPTRVTELYEELFSGVGKENKGTLGGTVFYGLQWFGSRYRHSILFNV